MTEQCKHKETDLRVREDTPYTEVYENVCVECGATVPAREELDR